MITFNQASGYRLPDFPGPVEIAPLTSTVPLIVPDGSEIVAVEGGSMIIVKTPGWSAVVTVCGVIKLVSELPPASPQPAPDDGQQHD